MALNTQRVPRTAQVPLTTTQVQIADWTPDRVLAIISNIGTAVGYIGFDQNLTAANGYGIPPNGYVVVTSPAPIFAIGTASTTTLTIYEDAGP